uniref:Myosin IXb n=1 Tax=Electrophorus electricus TaxID=8005 RepID=A0AAY5F5U9_ELEEL
MNILKSNEAASQHESAYVLQIYARLDHKTFPCCTIKVDRGTTAASIIHNAAPTLGLDMSKPYELVEVREFGREEWVLQASDLPVERVLLWPQQVRDQISESHGYFFALQMENTDRSGWYDHMAASNYEREARRPATEGILMTQPEDCNDLCNLPVLNEKTILDTLCCRFHKNQIYTYASNILIAINPFKFLPIYNPKYVEMYENHTLDMLDPHIFAIANAAFHTMLNKQLNQCIVISGESGSGKTQSTNFLIHCLTAMSRKGCTSSVERTILGAGPVLEAFGNAKTAYNNNSSRFGKFIQVNFLEGGIVRGAMIEKYLLEKCRLVTRKSSERNYHVFYYLLIGSSEEEKEEFKLLAPEDYNYLKQDNPQLEDQAEIKCEFNRLHQAMEMVGFLPATKKQILSVLSAILYLGNVTYEQKGDGEGVTVGPADVLSTLCDLLKVKVELLMEALIKRKAMTANDVLILPYTHSQAVTARDSMAKSLYSSLFDWIVLRINYALLNKRDMEESVPCLSLGILDIFGFEDFKTNSFEQFCINYANEQLQHYCSQHIFRLEQEEYLAEGITWTTVDYTDNIGCINLISKKPTGLLYLLDEESSFPHATDNTLLEKFKRQHQDNPFFVPTPVLEPAFIVLHYAGKVKYQIKDFRAKNTDHMRPDIVALLRSSECSYIRQLLGSDPVAVFRWGILRATIRSLAAFKEMGRRSLAKCHGNNTLYIKRLCGEVPQKLLLRLNKHCSYSSLLDPGQNLINARSLKLIVDLNLHNRDTRSLLHLHKKKKPPSISAQFQTSLVRLLDTLRKAEPFFIRCIRSNAEKVKEMQFDEDLVLRQLRYTGMLETVRIKRSGYGVKYTFKEFTEEYRVLLPKNASTPREDISNLLCKIGMNTSHFQIGKTKVFLKEVERQKLQESLYREVMHRILTLQRWFRACLSRKNFLMKRKAIITIQRCWRNYHASTCYRAAIVIQKAWRESHQRREYLRQRESLRKLKMLKRCSELKRCALVRWTNVFLLFFLSPYIVFCLTVRSPQSYYANTGCAPAPLNRKRSNPSIKISRGTRVQEQWKASMNRQITDCSELHHLDEFLGNQVGVSAQQSRVQNDSREKWISYKGLLQGYKSKVVSLATKKPDEVPMVVNLFESVLDGFSRAEIKRNSLESDNVKESPLDHSFSTCQVNIVQSCDLCCSFIWGMEKACMCSSCKMMCHKKCLSKIITYCFKRVPRKTETDKTTTHFGVHIRALTNSISPVPVILEMMLTHVEMNGLYIEGIYRKSGSACKAKELHQLDVCLENYPIHTVTGVIKSWLRELPEPLMTFSLYNDFLYAIDLPEKSERLRAVYRKLEDLPTSNFDTLERLIFHLVKVAKEESHNRMSANSLAIVFAPCILRCPDVTDPLLSMKDLPKTTLCLEVLIMEQIKRYDEKMKDIQQLEQAEAIAVKRLKLPDIACSLTRSLAHSLTRSLAHSLTHSLTLCICYRSMLACTLPELDQDTSDNDNLDWESTVSSDSLQDLTSLDLEGQ